MSNVSFRLGSINLGLEGSGINYVVYDGENLSLEIRGSRWPLMNWECNGKLNLASTSK